MPRTMEVELQKGKKETRTYDDSVKGLNALIADLDVASEHVPGIAHVCGHMWSTTEEKEKVLTLWGADAARTTRTHIFNTEEPSEFRDELQVAFDTLVAHGEREGVLEELEDA